MLGIYAAYSCWHVSINDYYKMSIHVVSIKVSNDSYKPVF